MPKSISISQIPGKPGQVYYPLSLDEVPKPTPKGTEVLVKMHTAALNHRDLFLRQALYPAIGFGIPLLADGCGTVVGLGDDADKKWEGKRVIINPGTGWKDNPQGPEEKGGYRILGGTKVNPLGTLAEYVAIDQGELELAPEHLSDVEAGALPLTGLTAWRAVMVKCGELNLGPGKNVLITGIGGGVALMALMFAGSTGANVYVTSGNQDKLERAKGLGAKGGVSYKQEGWEKQLKEMLPAENKQIDAIVDGAGADVVEKGAKLLKVSPLQNRRNAGYLARVIADSTPHGQPGGVIAIYGMTTGPKAPFLMQAVLKNIEVKGSTMGSRKDFRDMVQFVREKQAKPVVSRVVGGIDNLDAINDLFEDMKSGSQFGKLVIEINKGASGSKL